MSLFHSDGRNFCFREDALLTKIKTLLGDQAEEEFNNDLSRPRKVHYNNKWKPHQGAVYWIHVARAQEKGLHHHRNLDNPGHFGHCTEGRIRLRTAITPTYAHAYQSICLAVRTLVVLYQKFRLPAAKARNPNLPNSRTTTRETGNDFQGWAIYTDGGTRVSDGEETIAGCRAVARPMERYISCLAQLSQPKHISRTLESDAIPTTLLNSRVSLRRFPSLDSMAWLPRIHKRVSSTIPGIQPAFAWALSNHEQTSSLGSPASVSC